MVARAIRTVLTTVPDTESGARLCRALLAERLIACGTVLPGARSIYRWEGRVQDEAEAFVVLKTARSRVADLMRTVRGLHPYDVPEVLVLRVEAGDEAYTEWVVRETAPVGDDDGPAAVGRTGEP
ncbi:MAG: divalent-cation tolerance protein CutA [Gammaproteobacteria bacterium]|nr:divalent-cation tolerance protein CutA [Gammaproteobacteria bacterium]MDE0247563.1 divalent-cation tolerance protein CutA [Gammaproteobacteria bacterium]